MADFDAIVIGGGMVGLTTACALGQRRLRVAVIEAQPPDFYWSPESFGQRVSAITHASRRILSALDVWPAMLAQRVTPFREMHVWDAAGSGQIHFDSFDAGVTELGYIVENRVIQAALWARAQALETVELYCPTRWRRRFDQGNQVAVHLADGEALTGQLVIGADGGRSRVREEAGIQVHRSAYGQSAVVATVRTGLHHRHTAWQRFLPSGPLAFLPLSGHYSSIVWSTTPEQAEQLMGMDEAQFADCLGDAFEHALGEVLEVQARAVFPLAAQHATDYVKPRLALVGDAAHIIHPLAGQGVNLGFLDAAALAEVLLDAHHNHRDIGSLATLRRYARWRKGYNAATMMAMTGFKQLFGSRLWPVQWARNVGLNMTNALLPLKQLYMQQAMGASGDLPKLAMRDVR